MKVLMSGMFLVAIVVTSASVGAQRLVVQNVRTATLIHAPGTPECFAATPVHGDPRSQPSIFLMRGGAGCTVPWHWHSAGENIIMTSGHARAQVRGHGWTALAGGDYISVPRREAMRFSCVDRCALYLYSDGPFTLHYVDAHGSEITPDKALRP